MKDNLEVENDFFKMEVIQGVAILEIRGDPLYKLADIEAKAALLDCMDAIDGRDDIGVMVIIGPTGKPEDKEYVDFFRRIKDPGTDRKSLHEVKDFIYRTDLDSLARFCNAVNQLVLKIVSSKKFVIHADSGLIISPFMNLSLACDYRIIGQDSYYKNPYLELGLVPKGGSAFFLTRLIGYRNALNVLLADNAVSATQALALGIVDQVVPPEDIYATALKTAQRYAEFPSGSMAGIKSLLNCCTADLKYCLHREDELLTRIINSRVFIDKTAANKAAVM